MSRIRFENIGEVLERLGGISPRRIRAWPAPGRATEKDLLRVLEHENRVCELVDGVLVEKIMGLKESALAGDILWQIKNFVEPRDLGLVTPGDGPLRLLSGLVRLPHVSFVSWRQLPTHEYPDEPIPSLYPDLAVSAQRREHAGRDGAKTQGFLPGGNHAGVDRRPETADRHRPHRTR